MDTSKMELIATDDFDAYVEMEGGEELFLAEYNGTLCEEEDAATSIHDERVREYYDDQMNGDYDYFIDEYGNTDVLIIADLGLWNGRREGGKYGRLSSLMGKMIEDYNYIYFDEEKGVFVLKAIHHDGTNYFTIYKLTEEGKEYLEDDGDYREGHQHVINTEGMTTRFEL